MIADSLGRILTSITGMNQYHTSINAVCVCIYVISFFKHIDCAFFVFLLTDLLNIGKQG